MKNKWDAIFEEEKNKKTWVFCIVASILVITIIIIVRIVWRELDNSQIANSILNTFLSICTGVLSAALLNLIYRAYESKKISMIKSISFNGMLSDFFSAIEKIEGKDRRDEQITLEFDEYKDSNGNVVPEMIYANLEYDFKTKLRDRSFCCSIKRIISTKKANEELPEYTGGMSEKLIPYEFYWANDETSFVKDVVTNESYSITDAYIDEHKLKLNRKENDNIDDIDIEFRFEMSKMEKLDLKSYHTIRFNVKIPMEKESILFLTHEYPTSNTRVIIKYEKMVDKIQVYTMPVTGAIPVKHQVSEEKGKDTYIHSGWILPKSGYIVAWWERRND